MNAVKRLLLVFIGTIGVLFILGMTRMLGPISDWIYGYRFHDKIAHVVIGALYTLLLIWCLHPRHLQFGKLVLPAGAILMLGLSLFDELMQKPLPGRDANPLDLLASLIGISCGLLLWYSWKQAPALKALLFRKEIN